MHLILLAVMWYGGRLLHYDERDCKALIFTGASKTVTLALATLDIIMTENKGNAVVPCLIFYFLQMLIDSSIAGKMGLAARKKAEN